MPPPDDAVDLFGMPLTPAALEKIAGKKRKDPTPAGYYAPPGTGPDGETCKTCRHLTRHRFARVYHKCGKASATWTGGKKTDVLVRSPACQGWEPMQ